MEIKQTDIDLFIINRSLLSDETIAEIEKRIENDEVFRLQVLEVKEFYEKFHALESSSVKNIYELKPLESETAGNDLQKFAAMNEEAVADIFQHYNTYASAEKFVLIKILHNRSRGEYNLYIMCEDESSDCSNAVVRINGNEREYIADENAVACVKEEYIEPKSNITVKFPSAIFEFENESLNEENVFSSSNIGMKIFNKGNYLNIYLSNLKDEKMVYVIVNNDLVNYEVCEIHNNSVTLTSVPSGKIKLLIV